LQIAARYPRQPVEQSTTPAAERIDLVGREAQALEGERAEPKAQPATVEHNAARVAEPFVAKGIGEDGGAADIDRPVWNVPISAPTLALQPLRMAVGRD
jgi:hypothetical protein